METNFRIYTIIKMLGQHEASSKYLVNPTETPEKRFVLQVFDKPVLSGPAQREKFLQEIGKTRALEHSLLVPIVDAGIETRRAFVVSPYLTGGSLRDLLIHATVPSLTLARSLEIITQIGQALIYLHAHDITHGHLAPEHVFFDEHKQAMLGDIYHFEDQPLPSSSPDWYYQAPEQFRATASVDKKGRSDEEDEPSISHFSDQYALCCMAYEMITAQPPIKETVTLSFAEAVLQGSPQPLDALGMELPPGLNEILLKGLAKDPADRYPDIATLLADIESLAAQLETPTAAISKSSTSSTASIPTFPVPRTKRRQSMLSSSSALSEEEDTGTDTESGSDLQRDLEALSDEFKRSLLAADKSDPELNVETATSKLERAPVVETHDSFAEHDVSDELLASFLAIGTQSLSSMNASMAREEADIPTTKLSPALMPSSTASASLSARTASTASASLSARTASAASASLSARTASAVGSAPTLTRLPSSKRFQLPIPSFWQYDDQTKESHTRHWSIPVLIAAGCLSVSLFLNAYNPGVTFSEHAPLVRVTPTPTPTPTSLTLVPLTAPPTATVIVKPTARPRSRPKPRPKAHPTKSPVIVVPTQVVLAPTPTSPPPAPAPAPAPASKPKPTPTPVPPLFSGQLTAYDSTANSYSVNYINGFTGSNIRIEADIKNQGNGGGIIFRSPNGGATGYRLRIGTDGYYDLASPTGQLINNTKSASIKTGQNVWNHVTIVANGSQITIWANGQLLNQLTDSSYSTGGVAVMTVDFGAIGTTVCMMTIYRA
ncbi:protein kinase domain-containing protein [Dictyobacter arantiisoli]|uniref:non-specific serine/threonine protein kinase n=1 Tax=Dictyobacter arantiisoli TaxID=2014874 RepID=A0A5A5TID7_9CHLR|nr:protein kinase [Dictyobacter arantiisoli]GCF10769.1 hypothetical protein KDI_43330 [Dictyobacter arantiisoli]